MNRLPTMLALGGAALLAGCAVSSGALIAPARTQERPIEALPPEVHADIITVHQFRRVSDQLARGLVVQPFITRSGRPPVVAVRKLENKTGIEIDEGIFQETIRARLMEHAQGAVLFRDDVSYRDILEERARQSSDEVTVTITDSVVTSKGVTRGQEREFESGRLSGSTDRTERARNVEERRELELAKSASVRSGVADADYFLRGIIYQIREQDARNPRRGMNYFQYQFRVVDARTGLIVWEQMLDSKMEGIFTPVTPPTPPPVPVQPTGATPQGWPAPQSGQPQPGPAQPGAPAWPPGTTPPPGSMPGGQPPAPGWPSQPQPGTPPSPSQTGPPRR